MSNNLGHFCYGCNEYFHDSNPHVITHKGCKGNKSIGICVDSREFGKYYYGNLRKLPKETLIQYILELTNEPNNK